MKTIATVLADLDRKVTNTWATTLTSPAAGALDTTDDEQPTRWPLRLSLGKPTSTHLATDWPTVQRWAIDWRTFAAQHHLTLDWTNRSVTGIRQPLPTHLHIPDLDTAATLLDTETRTTWTSRLARARHQHATLQTRFPAAATAATLVATERLTDIDFALLITAADWFTHHDATGLTPRQVPVAGLHGKWLNHHHRLIQTLTGKPDLGLTRRPTRIHYTYLDPTHLDSGHRRHDAHTLTDTSRPDYQPRIVVITENKDTAVLFPRLPDAVAIEGNGNAGPRLLPQIDWIHAATHIYYWGDIDAAGYTFIHRYRAAGLPVRTLLMDQATYTRYEPYGAFTDDKNNPIPVPERKPLPLLTPAEQEVYDHLTDPTHTRTRRIEQERIPLDAALAALHADLAAPHTAIPATVHGPAR